MGEPFGNILRIRMIGEMDRAERCNAGGESGEREAL
jgi:hypothetical protein